jgi:hypothetical protein
MKNVTVTLEDDVARWARVYAAENEISVSRMLGMLLKERMRREQSYQTARARFLSRKPEKLREPGGLLPDRGELHDRTDIR